MTKLEVTEWYRYEIVDALAECTEESVRSNGRTAFMIYCDAHTGVKVVETCPGEKKLPKLPATTYYITTVCETMPVIMRNDGSGEEEDDEEKLADAIIDYIESIDFEERLDEIEENIFYEGGR